MNAEEVTHWVMQILLFWICYPKQSSKIKTDSNRDIIWEMVESTSEYRLVSNVAIDETWSALRLRHEDKKV